MWFTLSLVGYFFQAIVFVLDKIAVDKTVPKPEIYAFYSTIVMFLVFLFLPFGGNILPLNLLLLSILSGLGFGLGMWHLFKSISLGEATHIDAFNGAVVTVFVFLFSYFFLRENLNNYQLMGVVVLVISAFIFSFEKTEKHSGFHIGFIYAITSGLFFAISSVFAKYLYLHADFFSALIWTKGSTGLIGLVLLLYPTVRKNIFKKQKSKIKKKWKKRKFTILLSSKLLSSLAVLIIQLAISLGSVTLVTAMGGLQYVFMFIIIYFLTKLKPKIIFEFFTRREILSEVLALFLIVFGSILLVIN